MLAQLGQDILPAGFDIHIAKRINPGCKNYLPGELKVKVTSIGWLRVISGMIGDYGISHTFAHFFLYLSRN